MAVQDELPGAARRALAAITPHPHRGDLIAAGVAPLTLGMLLVNVRLDATWGTGAFFVLTGLLCALVLTMGVRAPLEGERPRSYQQVLQLAGLLLLLVTLLRLAQLLGAHDPISAPGARFWVVGLVSIAAAAIARTRRSAICILVAAVGAIIALLAFVDWAFAPRGATTTRWVLLAVAVAYVLGALNWRERARRESVYLIDAAGIAIVLLGLTFLGALVRVLTLLGIPGGAPGGGWKLILVAAGFGLVAYAGVDREPGPGYIGALVLLLFVGLAGLPGAAGASLWFWPLILLLIGALMVGFGLRPRRELPPEPEPAGGGPAETIPGPRPRAPDPPPEQPTRPLEAPRKPGSLWAGPGRDEPPAE